jgi:hypothetical protein
MFKEKDVNHKKTFQTLFTCIENLEGAPDEEKISKH